MKIKKETARLLLKIAGILFIAFLVGCVGYVFNLPDVQSLKKQNPIETAFMRHWRDRMRAQKKKPEKSHIWVPYSEISPYLKQAVIVSEDDAFYLHKGIDYNQLRQAIRRNFERGGFFYGGSTITQQLAKNLYLSPSKNPLRKIKEALIARSLEKHLSKRRILEIYLNIAEWGPGIYGAEAASIHYFSKNAIDLTPEESAILAAYLPSPRRLSQPKNANYVEQTAQKILKRMKARGFLPYWYWEENMVY